jgi:hypothetical protein
MVVPHPESTVVAAGVAERVGVRGVDHGGRPVGVAVDEDPAAGDDGGRGGSDDVVTNPEGDVGLGPDAAPVGGGALVGQGLRVVLRDELDAGREEDQVLRLHVGVGAAGGPARGVRVRHREPHEAAEESAPEDRQLVVDLGDRDVEVAMANSRPPELGAVRRRVDLDVVAAGADRAVVGAEVDAMSRHVRGEVALVVEDRAVLGDEGGVGHAGGRRLTRDDTGEAEVARDLPEVDAQRRPPR